MKSPERQRLCSSILHHSLMFKIIALFLFDKWKCFDGKLDQTKAAKHAVKLCLDREVIAHCMQEISVVFCFRFWSRTVERATSSLSTAGQFRHGRLAFPPWPTHRGSGQFEISTLSSSLLFISYFEIFFKWKTFILNSLCNTHSKDWLNSWN